MAVQKEELSPPNIREDLVNIRENVREVGDSIYRAMQDTKEVTQSAILDSLDKAKKTSQQAQRGMVAYVKKNPLKSLLIGVVSGLITAKLIGR